MNFDFQCFFNRKSLKEIPQESGVYFLTRYDGEVLYVGQSIDVRMRIKEHVHKGSEMTKRDEFKEIKLIKIIFTDKENLLEAEKQNISKYNPKFNIRKDEMIRITTHITQDQYDKLHQMSYKGKKKDKKPTDESFSEIIRRVIQEGIERGKNNAPTNV